MIAVLTQRLGDQNTTAQVNPRLLTEAFMAKATELKGSEVLQGAVHDIIVKADEDGNNSRVTGASPT